MKLTRSCGLAIAILLAVHGFSFAADEKPALPFSDNMVIQREAPAPVWGRAAAGQRIIVTIDKQKKTATADADGNWSLDLDAMPAGGPFEMVIEGKNKLTIKNVMVGEVWLCSGQSNMQLTVERAKDSAREIAESRNPDIRMLSGGGAWQAASPATTGRFSAAGYYFGRELHRELKVAIGLIHESVGGTSARLWTPPETIKATPELAAVLADYEKAKANLPKALEAYDLAHKAWEANKVGREPMKPRAVAPGSLYENMIVPVIPYRIRGAIWYQGETDAGRSGEYATLFPTMIQGWRKAWGQGDFPFLFVQLPNYQGNWAPMRAVQQKCLAAPNTGMAVTIDIGEEKDIHPKNKQDVGKRLALIALARVYGQKVVCSGPVYDSFSADGGKGRIKFTETGGGLVAKGSDGGELKGFLIAGEDKKFVPAQAKLEGDAVVVWSESVAKPVAVRYAWEPNPTVNLYNKEGLPAAPFRTDHWE